MSEQKTENLSTKSLAQTCFRLIELFRCHLNTGITPVAFSKLSRQGVPKQIQISNVQDFRYTVKFWTQLFEISDFEHSDLFRI